jgi:hypothetical protein
MPITSNHRILEAIRYHDFGVIFEVTNGITHIFRRQDKKKQIRLSRRIIQTAVGDAAEINSGLALFKNNQPPIKEVDYLLKINDYNPSLLFDVAERVVNSPSLSTTDKDYLGNLLQNSWRFGPERFRKYFSPNRPLQVHYKGFPRIKGAVLEHYVKELFVGVLQQQHSFAMGSLLYEKRTKSTEADIIIAADKSDFMQGLEELTTKYNNRQRVSVKYKE